MRRSILYAAPLAALFCTIPTLSMEVPTDLVVQNLNGVQQCIKTFTTTPDVDPATLMEDPFDYEGCTYTFASITKAENFFAEEKSQSQVVTVETSSKDLTKVLEALSPSLPYDDGKYQGTLNLDHTTIQTEAAGYTTKSYGISATKEIGNLDTNDMAYVPATTVKDGVTIPLSNVDWQVQGTALVGDTLVPSLYKAVATYSGTGYYTAATGYVTTAEYTGIVHCNELDSITYTLTYVGQEITEEPEPIAAAKPFWQNHWVLGSAGLVLAAVAFTSGLLLARRHKEDLDESVDMDLELDEETEEIIP